MVALTKVAVATKESTTMILYKNGSALLGERLVKTDILANHGRIIEIAPDIVPDDQTEVINCQGRFLLPALVDIHTHGANGYDFNTADLDGMKKIMEFYVSHGVGTVLPTIMTDSDEVIFRQIKLVLELAKDFPEVKGIHLEGPFLSPEKCGAMPVEHLQKPSVDKFVEYQKVANGFIKIVTVAPELADGIAFISEVSDMGVVCSIGHTNATADVIEKAVEAGAKSFTHWGNAMSQMDRLDIGALGMAMLGNTFVEVIPDGKHVSKDAIKLLVKAKGLDSVVCVTDSIMATGLTDGSYTLGAQSVTVTEGNAYLAGTTTRAGSTLDAYSGLANMVEFCGLPLAKAIKLWTTNPAKLIGMDKRIGTIEIGKDADFIIFGV